jgi:hypothetical protein
MSLRRLTASVSIALTIVLVVSTEAFYRALFFSGTPINSGTRCAVIVSNGGDTVESAALLSSVRRLGISGNIYAYSLVFDATLPERLDSFYMKDQNIKYLGPKELNDDRIMGCVFAYPPHLYCSVADMKSKYTLLPRHVGAPYIPDADFLTINARTIAHCLSTLL